MNRHNKQGIILGLLVAIGCSSFGMQASAEYSFADKPFTFLASCLKNQAKKPEVVTAGALLIFMIKSAHTLITSSALKDEDCDAQKFGEDVKCTIDALAHGNITGFCSGVKRMWRVYFVGRTRKLVDTEVKTISEDGKTEKTVKDKDLVRLEFGVLGWIACAGGAMKDVFDKIDPIQKTFAFVGLVSVFGLNQE